MKLRLLDFLICPKCGSSFECEIFSQHNIIEKIEIDEGIFIVQGAINATLYFSAFLTLFAIQTNKRERKS